MDFLKILKSFEEFVYEALTWLVLLPRTLWRIVLAPRRMTAYAGAQIASQSETRFSEAISPPLLLILCVLLSHVVDLAVRHPAAGVDGTSIPLLSSEQNLLLYRTIAFGVWSLAGALYMLVRTRRPVDRESLRAPFYEQCYLVAPFALVVSLSLTWMAVDRPWVLVASLASVVVATVWFWLAQAAWLRRHASLVPWRSLVAAALVLVAGSIVNVAVGQMLLAMGTPAATATAGDPAR